MFGSLVRSAVRFDSISAHQQESFDALFPGKPGDHAGGVGLKFLEGDSPGWVFSEYANIVNDGISITYRGRYRFLILYISVDQSALTLMVYTIFMSRSDKHNGMMSSFNQGIDEITAYESGATKDCYMHHNSFTAVLLIRISYMLLTLLAVLSFDVLLQGMELLGMTNKAH